MKKIKKILITQLFDLFDHEILLNQADRVTIIHGANGMGKTTILKIVKAIFSHNDEILFKVKYKEINIDFDDDSKITITRTISKHNKEDYDLRYKIITTNGKPIEFKREFKERKRPSQIIRYFHDNCHDNLSESKMMWENFTQDLFIESNPKSKEVNQIKELNRIRKWINIALIETQRLFNLQNENKIHEEYNNQQTLQVLSFAEDIKKAIKDRLAESAMRTQALDRTFPMRLLTEKHDVLTTNEILSRLSELDQQRAKYNVAGLLDEESDAFLPKSISDHERMVLSVYIQDVEKKLEVLDELSKKIELLKKIINQRFLYKKLEVSKEKGLTFRTDPAEQELLPSELSSGEQHELILFYQLLFKTDPSSLVVIDEPELSLHVVWQHEFLRDLIEIANLGNLNVIIATHSPQIINDRWDLTVELRGPLK